MKCGSQEKKPAQGSNIKEIVMARHKKHERMKELDRKRHRREKVLKARIKEAKEAKA